MTNKQEQFINEYMKDLNGSAAAIRAGYAPNNARSTAYKLLQKPTIQDEIKARLHEAKLSSDQVLQLLANMSMGFSPTKTTILASGKTRVEYDQAKATELVGKYHALFTDKHIVSQLDGMEIIDSED